MPGRDKTVIDAYDLLELYLESRGLVPKQSGWSEERLAGNPLRLIRYQRLVALFKAFGIRGKVAEFHTGRFIDVDNPAYLPLFHRIRQECPEGLERWCDIESIRWLIPRVFEKMLRYRVKLNRALGFLDGVLITNPFNLYAERRIGKLNSVIDSNKRIVDDLLAELISPEGAKFLVADLARDHGYPVVDLSEVDLDFF